MGTRCPCWRIDDLSTLVYKNSKISWAPLKSWLVPHVANCFLARSLFRWFRGSAAYGPGSSEMRQPTLPPLWEWRTGPKNNMLSWASAHRGKWGQLASPWKNRWKIKKTKTCKKSSFLRLCYTLWAIRAGRCRERRYADHIFIQVGLYFRMHHFVVKLSKFSSPQTAKKNWPP